MQTTNIPHYIYTSSLLKNPTIQEKKLLIQPTHQTLQSGQAEQATRHVMFIVNSKKKSPKYIKVQP